MAPRIYDALTRVVANLGNNSRVLAEHAGELGIMVWNMGVACVRLRVPSREIFRQIFVVGIQSVPIVVVAAGLIGVVTSQQGGYQMQSNLPQQEQGAS